MLHFVETTACVSILRGRTPRENLPLPELCAVSVITAAELEVGVRRSTRPLKQRKAVDDLLASVSVVAFEFSVVAHYGDIRAHLERIGQPIGPMDLLIAAHARSLGAAVLTANVKEFRRVPGLTVIHWG